MRMLSLTMADRDNASHISRKDTNTCMPNQPPLIARELVAAKEKERAVICPIFMNECVKKELKKEFIDK
jgi:hypothetical protein